eukprot:5757008-Prymnesium_polylepis.1
MRHVGGGGAADGQRRGRRAPSIPSPFTAARERAHERARGNRTHPPFKPHAWQGCGAGGQGRVVFSARALVSRGVGGVADGQRRGRRGPPVPGPPQLCT